MAEKLISDLQLGAKDQVHAPVDETGSIPAEKLTVLFGAFQQDPDGHLEVNSIQKRQRWVRKCRPISVLLSQTFFGHVGDRRDEGTVTSGPGATVIHRLSKVLTERGRASLLKTKVSKWEC